MSQSPSVIRSIVGRLVGAERRTSNRTQVSGLWCDKGKVIDLSPRGMRLTSARRWAEGLHKRVTISDGERSVTIDARCVWCRQDGVFSHAVGLAFENVNPESGRQLTALAEANADAIQREADSHHDS